MAGALYAIKEKKTEIHNQKYIYIKEIYNHKYARKIQSGETNKGTTETEKKSNLGWSPDFEVADCASNWFRMNLGQTGTDGGQELRSIHKGH